MLRFNPHGHCIIMEVGIDESNDFYHVKIRDTNSLIETIKRVVVSLFVDKKLLNKDFANQDDFLKPFVLEFLNIERVVQFFMRTTV